LVFDYTGGIMRLYMIFLLVLCISYCVDFADAQEPEKEKAALTAATKWLSLIDSWDYGASWKEAAEYFRTATTEDMWVQSLKHARNPLGKLISRQIKSTHYTTWLPGAPDGEYVVIRFETSFEHKRSAIETVTPMFEKDSLWRVSGYYIK
jgi:hypothetical protein